MSGRVRAGIALAAVAAGLVAAPAAEATDYEFLASNGTACTLQKARSLELEPDAQWTIGWRSDVTCRGAPLWGVNIHTDLWRWMPDGWPMTYPGSTGFCERPELGARRPCGTWTVRSEGLVRDLPGADYEHHTSLGLTLPEAEVGEVQPVWLVTPVASGCLPGGRTTGCEVLEEFTLE